MITSSFTQLLDSHNNHVVIIVKIIFNITTYNSLLIALIIESEIINICVAVVRVVTW